MYNHNKARNLWLHRGDLNLDKTHDDGFPTVTSDQQKDVEATISAAIDLYSYTYGKKEPKLLRSKHAAYLKRGLRKLSVGFECLDASRVWLVYWSLHGLHLLEEQLDEDLLTDITDFLANCQDKDGGFGGGPGQLPHLAPTYAAVNALVTIGTPQAFAVLDRQKLANFLSRMVTPEGSFRMHEGGEVDIRGTYCAVAVARLARVAVHPLFSKTPEWIVKCQTYEGGFSGTPGLEAHGGYTFCGFAALALLHSQHMADIDTLLRWVAGRQMRYSGGFQGRTNKLVDGCYSFWQGGLFPIIHHTLELDDYTESPEAEQHWLFNCEALQNYLLVCCQKSSGGLIDKPGKSPDFYHTCYTLSGLSVAQHYCYDGENKLELVGPDSNELALTHPLHNVGMSAVMEANRHFRDVASVQPANVEIHTTSSFNGVDGTPE